MEGEAGKIEILHMNGALGDLQGATRRRQPRVGAASGSSIANSIPSLDAGGTSGILDALPESHVGRERLDSVTHEYGVAVKVHPGNEARLDPQDKDG